MSARRSKPDIMDQLCEHVVPDAFVWLMDTSEPAFVLAVRDTEICVRVRDRTSQVWSAPNGYPVQTET